jgi:hypothetical protein
LSEIASVVVVFLVLCASAGFGLYIRPRLPERHRARETIELMQVTIGLLATFAAIVLGLITASAKQRYDDAAHDRRQYSLQLTSLDRCLRGYGPDSAPARRELRGYTAAVIASTWPNEPAPAGIQYPDTAHMPRIGASPVLGLLMNDVGAEMSRLAPATTAQARLLDLCLDQYKDVLHARASVIEDADAALFSPFYVILVFWLMIIFLCFGLVAPPNSLSLITIMLSSSLLSSVIFVILELDRPYSGYFGIPSTAMRDALSAMLS